MPELPEVEIVKQSLNQKIKYKKIQKIIIRNRNLRFKLSSQFEKDLINKEIKKISRLSKYIIFHLADNNFCIAHLGMSGTIHLVEKNKKNFKTNTSFYSFQNLPKKHNHIEIHLGNLIMIYNDPRRFGFFKFMKSQNELSNFFKNLGPEPFSKSFNYNYVFNYFVSGIGNIYSNEILFLCKIKPFKKAKKLSLQKCKKLIYFSKYVLSKAIKKGGSTIRDFKNTLGNEGKFQDEFRVYEREHLNCRRKSCNGVIKKKFISNRSTYFCNVCQK